MDTPVCSSTTIYNEAQKLLEKINLRKAVRLAGVGVSSLKDVHTPVQMQLIHEVRENTKQWEKVDHAVDHIMDKFGSRVINKASLKPPEAKTPEDH